LTDSRGIRAKFLFRASAFGVALLAIHDFIECWCGLLSKSCGELLYLAIFPQSRVCRSAAHYSKKQILSAKNRKTPDASLL
jgi:hypothetical protein